MKKDCSQPYVCKEDVAEQIAEKIGLLAVPREWTDWMLANLEQEQVIAWGTGWRAIIPNT